MGVKSTVFLTREAAQRRLFEAIPSMLHLTDPDLADLLMHLNDALHGGEGYENYVITEYAEKYNE